MSKEETKVEERKSEEKNSSVEEPLYYRLKEHKHKNGAHEEYASKMFELMDTHMTTDVLTLQTHIVKHFQYNLARSQFSMDNKSCYKAVSFSVRDYLIESNNDTRAHMLSVNPKIAYYFSMEYLPGRTLKNAILSLDLLENYAKALDELGYKLEDLYDEEVDPGLGNGGLGRLASCLLDSLATHEYPVWGYGIRFDYGIFKQKIVQGGQCEVPDYWLIDGYPWEIRRNDVGYRIGFYGKVEREQDKDKESKGGKEKVVWKPEEEVHALAFDQLVPGYNTYNTVTLRLWRSRPATEFDLESFNQGEFDKALQAQQKAEFITSVLYPNDESEEGKELRLKQQYFHVSASLQDILLRFKVVNEDLNLLPEKVAVQLNDTHPSLGIVELMRILLDIEGLEWDHAWGLVTKVFAYTNHTVMPEALEKWDKKMFQHLLPRHAELVEEINKRFLKEVSKKFPKDKERLKRMPVIDDKKVHMAYLAIVGSHVVNGVAKIHSELIKKTIFKDFYEMWPEKFQNKTNGVTHRRWVGCANMDLAQFYTEQLGGREWLSNMDLLKGLLSKVDDALFRKKWAEIKMRNKRRLKEWVEEKCGVTLDENSMFDVMTKRVHEYKRQLMNIMHVIYRYLQLKEASSEERKKFVPRSVLIGGKAATGYVIAKGVIRLIIAVGKVINEDEDTKDLLKVVFLPNYGVSNAEVIIPGADIAENISKVGTEASGTSNMKYCMNGALLMGTLDGANVEIVEEIGEENAFIFGPKLDEIEDIIKKTHDKKVDKKKYPEFFKAFEEVKKGRFGEHEELTALIESIEGKSDEYLVAYDFKSYIEAQNRVDELFKNKEEWTKKSILTALNCSKFTSDRTVGEYARDIWKIKPVKTPWPKEESYEDWKLSKEPIQDGKTVDNQHEGQRETKKQLDDTPVENQAGLA